MLDSTFIFLLCLVFGIGFFPIYFILFYFFFLSCLHSAWLSRDASLLPGGKGQLPASKKALVKVVGLMVTHQIRWL